MHCQARHLAFSTFSLGSLLLPWISLSTEQALLNDFTCYCSSTEIRRLICKLREFVSLRSGVWRVRWAGSYLLKIAAALQGKSSKGKIPWNTDAISEGRAFMSQTPPKAPPLTTIALWTEFHSTPIGSRDKG